MSIVQTQTTSFKKELYQAIHDFTVDTFKIALYTADANLNADTAIYSSTNEATGTGYTPGGVNLTGVIIASDGYTAYVNFANVTFGASVVARCALIYNSSKANRSVAVLDFGSDKTSANFTITMPANTPTTALIRSSN
jgi:O-glycosyl hydrolase